MSRCKQQGCLWNGIAPDGLVAALRASKVATVTVGSPLAPIRAVADTRETSVDEAPDLAPVVKPAAAEAQADDGIDDALHPVTRNKRAKGYRLLESSQARMAQTSLLR
jgi:hypothetical protein